MLFVPDVVNYCQYITFLLLFYARLSLSLKAYRSDLCKQQDTQNMEFYKQHRLPSQLCSGFKGNHAK